MSPTQTAAWATLTSHHRDLKKHSLEQLRQADPTRPDRYRMCTCQIELDYSRHHITDETLMLFEQLLNEQAWRAGFAGPRAAGPDGRWRLGAAGRFHGQGAG